MLGGHSSSRESYVGWEIRASGERIVHWTGEWCAGSVIVVQGRPATPVESFDASLKNTLRIPNTCVWQHRFLYQLSECVYSNPGWVDPK